MEHFTITGYEKLVNAGKILRDIQFFKEQKPTSDEKAMAFWTAALNGIESCLRMTPTANLVTCKDCEFWEAPCKGTLSICRRVMERADAEDFCSRAKRKEMSVDEAMQKLFDIIMSLPTTNEIEYAMSFYDEFEKNMETFGYTANQCYDWSCWKIGYMG